MSTRSRARDLISIGDFSRLTRLSVKALRLYDEERILVPARVEANGYRYYSLVQTVEAERIRLLRALDLPLPRIRELLSVPPADARVALQEHRSVLLERIAGLEQAVTSLDALLATPEPWSAYEVKFEELAPRQILSIRDQVREREFGPAARRAFAELFGHLGRLRIAPEGPPFALYHYEDFNEEAVDVEWCVPVPRPMSGVGRIEGRRLDGVRVASTLHVGDYAAIGPAYVALHQAITSAGAEPALPIREVYLVGPEPGRRVEAYRTALQWPLATGR